MRKEFEKPLQDFLAEGDGDDIYLGQIINRVGRVMNLGGEKLSTSETDALWQGIQEFIALMLTHGFIAINLLNCKPYRYEAWLDQSPTAVIKKIKDEWIRLKGENPDVLFIVWFHKM